MARYTDDDIRSMKKVTAKIAADYLGISPMAVTIGMRNSLLPMPDEEDDQDKVSLLCSGDRERATREELFQKVWAQPVSIVAKEYQITDNALRKRCITARKTVSMHPEFTLWNNAAACKQKRAAQIRI